MRLPRLECNHLEIDKRYAKHVLLNCLSRANELYYQVIQACFVRFIIQYNQV